MVSEDLARATEDALLALLDDPGAVIAQLDAAIVEAAPDRAAELERQRNELREIFPALVRTEGANG